MQRYIARHILMAKLAALALSALCFLQAPVQAQGTVYIVIFPSVGLAHDQILSFTLFNPNGAPVRAQSYLAFPGFTGGVTVASADINGGAFRSFNVKRSDIHQVGEAGTGRIQLSLSVRLSSSEAIKSVVASMELISISDGTSNTFLAAEVIPTAPSSGGGKDVLIGGDARDVLMGIPPDHKLRVTILNPQASGSEAQHEPVRGHVKVFDRSGNLIAQSPELVILPDEIRSFDIYRNEIPLAGEPWTNRAQARIKPFFTFESERLSPVLASFEIVNISTGKTVVLSGPQCLVFYLGGTPSN
jgi:hypothetical protein